MMRRAEHTRVGVGVSEWWRETAGRECELQPASGYTAAVGPVIRFGLPRARTGDLVFGIASSTEHSAGGGATTADTCTARKRHSSWPRGAVHKVCWR